MVARASFLASTLLPAGLCLLLSRRTDIAVAGERERHLLQAVVVVVEEDDGVEASAVELRFQMQMLCCCASCASREADHLACPHFLARLHEVSRLVAVERLEAVGVLYDNTIAVAGEWS